MQPTSCPANIGKRPQCPRLQIRAEHQGSAWKLQVAMNNLQRNAHIGGGEVHWKHPSRLWAFHPLRLIRVGHYAISKAPLQNRAQKEGEALGSILRKFDIIRVHDHEGRNTSAVPQEGLTWQHICHLEVPKLPPSRGHQHEV